MDPDAYCQAQAAPPGSSFHYSLLGLAPDRRRAAIALQALAGAIAATAGLSDPAIARAKHDWWRRDVDRLAGGRLPRHPASRALAPHLAPLGIDAALLHQLLDAAADDRAYNAYPEFAQLLAYCHRSGGTLALLRAQALGYRASATAAFAHDLGIGLRLIGLLATTREALQHQRFYLPEADMAAFQVTHQQLYDRVTTPPIRALFARQADRARDFLRRADAALDAGDRYSQRSQLAYAALKAAWLDEVERDGFRLLETRTRLTPLRKLWLAWRTLRRQRRYR